ncbi:MAG: cyclic nucleotide-binding domain-containing protein [Hyphomonadaceae bacterium]|nr:cyclic nucleotide-binding domain-containing protein [Hyphomonadaceae bacterium]
MCMTVGKLGEFGRETIFGAKAPRAAPGQTRDFHAGEHLFFEGDTRTHIFLVVSGWLKLYRTLVDGQR